ncbi:MAG: hypothetical protein ACM3X6_01395 [Patescibacteria group bacterium]
MDGFGVKMLTRLVKDARELLLEFEWVDGLSGLLCEICGCFKAHGHNPDCRLKKFLDETDPQCINVVDGKERSTVVEIPIGVNDSKKTVARRLRREGNFTRDDARKAARLLVGLRARVLAAEAAKGGKS